MDTLGFSMGEEEEYWNGLLAAPPFFFQLPGTVILLVTLAAIVAIPLGCEL